MEKYQQLKEDALANCRVPVRGYILVAIGEDDQEYWGANYGDPETARRMLRHVDFMRGSCKRFSETEKPVSKGKAVAK